MCFVTDRGQLREEFTFPHLPFTFTCTIDIYHLLKPSAFSIYLVTLCTEWKLLTVNTRNVPNTAQVFSEQHAWESKQQSIQCTLMAQEEIAVQQKATVFWQGSNALLINWQYRMLLQYNSALLYLTLFSRHHIDIFYLTTVSTIW